MSLKKNIVAQYATQMYQTIVAIAMVPVYIHYMGSEAYGLVGFYAVLQAWFQLLDLGLSPTLARETARFNGGATSAVALRGLLRLLECFFGIVGLVAGVAMFFGADAIAARWLHVQHLPLAEVRHSIMLMAGIVVIQWMSGLYRGAVTGFERLVWLSGYRAGIATLRYLCIVPFFIFVGASPVQFFAYQFGVALVGLIALIAFSYRLLPVVREGQSLAQEWLELKGMLRFALMIAFTGGVWVLMTQTDKLILSKLLPLAEYGYYTVAIQAANGVMIVSGPLSIALMPRMTNLVAQKDEAGLVRLYHASTQFICAISVSVAVVMALFAKQLLFAWTGSPHLVDAVAPVLALYALGNGVMSVSAFPYYLQYAKGSLILHVVGNILFLLLEIPAVVFLTRAYGMIGAGWVWLVANCLYFLLWIPVVHKRFLPRAHIRWLIQDILCIAVPVIVFAALMAEFAPWPRSRLGIVLELTVIGLMTLGIATVASPVLRNGATTFYSRRRVKWIPQ